MTYLKHSITYIVVSHLTPLDPVRKMLGISERVVLPSFIQCTLEKIEKKLWLIVFKAGY